MQVQEAPHGLFTTERYCWLLLQQRLVILCLHASMAIQDEANKQPGMHQYMPMCCCNYHLCQVIVRKLAMVLAYLPKALVEIAAAKELTRGSVRHHT